MVNCWEKDELIAEKEDELIAKNIEIVKKNSEIAELNVDIEAKKERDPALGNIDSFAESDVSLGTSGPLLIKRRTKIPARSNRLSSLSRLTMTASRLTSLAGSTSKVMLFTLTIGL